MPSSRTVLSSFRPAPGCRRSISTGNTFTPTLLAWRSMPSASLATTTSARRGFSSNRRAICSPIPLDAPVSSTTLSRNVRIPRLVGVFRHVMLSHPFPSEKEGLVRDTSL
eukprot:scaffold545_cov372-Pavlova_lutheri.AAC.27